MEQFDNVYKDNDDNLDGFIKNNQNMFNNFINNDNRNDNENMFSNFINNDNGDDKNEKMFDRFMNKKNDGSDDLEVRNNFFRIESDVGKGGGVQDDEKEISFSNLSYSMSEKSNTMQKPSIVQNQNEVIKSKDLELTDNSQTEELIQDNFSLQDVYRNRKKIIKDKYQKKEWADNNREQ